MKILAKKITTTQSWDDLVLDGEVIKQLEEVMSWIKRGNDNKLKSGYRCLFYGPFGNGKTLSAGLLGKATGRDVYRIDLSMVISKYIGETEKNISKIFDRAENKNWILFFDEADALFGKRTSIRDAHDKYANQEISYLLQRIEEFNGVVILSTNLKTNIDRAFLRRLRSIIQFPIPKK